MRKKDFESLLRGVGEVGAIIRGELKPARFRRIEPARVKSIRAKLGLSQTQFSRLIGVPPGTLRNWEQGVRRPTGPALALLRVAQKHPREVADALCG